PFANLNGRKQLRALRRLRTGPSSLLPISNLLAAASNGRPGLGNAPLLTESVDNFQCRVLLCRVELSLPKSGAIWQSRKLSFQNMKDEPMDRLEAMSIA